MYSFDEEKMECTVGNNDFCFWNGKIAKNVVVVFLTSGLTAFICLWLLVQPNSNIILKNKEEKIGCTVGNKDFCFWNDKIAENVFVFLTLGLTVFIYLWLLLQPNSKIILTVGVFYYLCFSSFCIPRVAENSIIFTYY